MSESFRTKLAYLLGLCLWVITASAQVKYGRHSRHCQRRGRSGFTQRQGHHTEHGHQQSKNNHHERNG